MSLFQHQARLNPNKKSYLSRRWKRFLKWMKYDPPGSLEADHWRIFNEEFKEKAPVRYFITSIVPDFIRPVRGFFTRIKDWIRYRTINRYHVIDTGLAPGYYEISDKVLHGPFNLLKNFVEKEQAWASQCWSSTNKLTRIETLPFYYEFFYCKPEIGIAHFNWAATLDDPTLPPGDRSEEQAKNAREVLALYTWWTETRPKRYIDEEGVTYSNQGFPMGPLDSGFDRTAADYVAFTKWHNEEMDAEGRWIEEDTEMLIRLIKIRSSLWT